jgi:L-lysine 2,3-aminomutase
MQQQNWQTLLQKSGKSPSGLLDDLGIDSITLSEKANHLFPFRVTDSFSRRIEQGNPDDPLLRQILPLPDEELEHPGFSTDPLAEQGKQPVPGLLHKYNGRALLIVTGACAIHCRYCFRRHFPYANANAAESNWAPALQYLAKDATISEVILSGGDPLTVSDKRLSRLVQLLAGIAHIKRLRIHSRIPVVLPERMTDELIHCLTATRLQTIMVLHVNHPNELDSTSARALEKMQYHKIPLLNQSVLLKGVNDSVEILIELSEKLIDFGVIPYYLHMLDPVQGTSHFAVEEFRAIQIMQKLHRQLPGYLIPRLVREVAGTASKIPVR